MNKILQILIIIVLFSCGQIKQDKEDSTNATQLAPFELTVWAYNYSMAYTLQYVLTESNLKIIHKGELKGEKDTVIYSTELQSNEKLKTLSNLKLDSLKGRYENPCILDGSQIKVNFKKDQKSKTIHLSNYYQKDIGIAIEQINELIPEKYKIWYDKDELLQSQKDCK